MCPTVAEMGVQMEQVSSLCARWRILRCGDFPTISSYGMSVRGCKMALVCQRVVLQLGNTLPNGVLVVKWRIFKAWKACSHFAAAKRVYLAAKWHLCAKGPLRSCENFRRGGWAAVKPFHSGKPFSQRLTLGCKILQAMLSPCFWAPLDSQLPSFTSFDIPPDFDNPKTYVTSKQIKIKALKSKLKQVINKTKRYGLASL